MRNYADWVLVMTSNETCSYQGYAPEAVPPQVPSQTSIRDFNKDGHLFEPSFPLKAPLGSLRPVTALHILMGVELWCPNT